MRILRATAFIALVAGSGCAGGPPRPASLDTKNDQCAFCRMAVSDQTFAGQLVAPAEEAKFFDDLGCLASYLSQAPLPRGTVAYVADHRSGQWVRAGTAVYTHVPTLDTPMGSGLLAHADEASRQGDPAAAGGEPRTAADVFGPSGPPDGTR